MQNKYFHKMLVMLLIFSSICFAIKAGLPELKPRTKTIAVFKNGLGFFIKEGKVTLKDGWAQTELVPRASLGSMWIASLDQAVTLDEVISYKEQINTNIEAITVAELIRANIGEKVMIRYGNNTVEGIIKSVPEDRLPETTAAPSYDYRSAYIPPQSKVSVATAVIISTKKGEVVLNKNNITEIKFPNGFSGEIVNKEQVKRIKFKAGSQNRNTKIGLSYLQKGVSWVPSYIVNIENPKKARITMKAIFINDIEDIDNVNVFFVVGYPNFIFADVLSPLALEQSITQFITALESGGVQSDEYGRLANVMSQRVTYIRGGRENIPSLDYGYAAIKGLPGAAEEDLFLYNKKNVNLKKGERAYYHIFSDEVDYKHVYEWNIPDLLNVDTRGYRGSGQGTEDREQIWHSIKLTNSTKYPWTTAPGLTISGWKPLAQDIINYTPKGAKTNLKLTVATDIKTDRNEYEIDRKRDIKMYYSSYDLVTVKGELYIKNFKNKNVIMEITKAVTGEVTTVSHNGKIKKIAEGLEGVNNKSIITWEIPVKTGKEINVAYKYTVYIRH